MLTSHGRHRYEQLDSLRGIAALVVVVYHASTFWVQPYPHWRVLFNQSPFGLLLSGPDAVYVFFVLSGFVLCLPYIRPEGPDSYGRYLIKRTCRIYLPYLAAVAISVACDLLFYHPLAARFPNWEGWNRPFPMPLLWDHILFLRHTGQYEFNPVFWSLVQEMRLSIAYPIIAFLALRLRLAVGIVVSLAICAGGFLLEDVVHTSEIRTVGYAGLFLLGALIARHLSKIRGLLSKYGGWGSAAVLALSVFLFKSTHLLPDRYYQWWTLAPLHGAGAALMVVLALTSVQFARLLHHPALQWLGRVSYSLYLVHCAILYSLVSVFWESSHRHFLLMAVGITLSLVVAQPMYHWIERPAIILGRRLTMRLHTPVAASV
jgi:peptidoglycan/LPS O-acetylase OafA/YrhL